MTRDLMLREHELIENPTARIPVCLVLDCSGSMSGEPIEELNKGLSIFLQRVKEDPIARHSVELAAVTFAVEAEAVLDFESIASLESFSVKIADDCGGTNLGKAVYLALELLMARKDAYKSAGVDYYQPWLIIMTDGLPTDNSHIKVSEVTSEMVMSKKLSVFPIATGPSADLGVLAMFSPKRDPLRLKELRYSEFFEWLSRSVSLASRSRPGESPPLDQNIKGWSEAY